MPDKDLARVLDPANIWKQIQAGQDEAIKLAATAVGQEVGRLWSTSKLYVISFILLFFIIKFEEKGIGSVVYNIFFLGIIGIFIAIFGWGIIFNSYFEIIYLLIYIIAYRLTRMSLIKLGVWRY
ncbi:MAG: hypothetical protein WC456_04120 [Patescibacteria group bacterium]